MISSRQVAALAALVGYALAAPAVAQDDAAKKNDPNEIVCEKQKVLGSRLAVKRVCMTRAEWAEQRRADRDMINKSQLGACMKQSRC